MRYTSILKWSVIIGLCLIPFTSFIIGDSQICSNLFSCFNLMFPASSFFPFITGKNFAFRIIVELVLLLYVILALREPKYRPRSAPLFWSVLAFVVWMGIATITSVDPIKSFWSNFERMDGYITVIHMLALFIVAGAMLTAEKWWNAFFRISVAAGTLQGLYALSQLLHWLPISSQSGTRVDTSFGNAIYVAVFMLFTIFITLYLLIRDRRSVGLQVFYGISLVLQFLALFYSQTRGALLGVILGLVVMGIYIAWRAVGTEWRTMRVWSFGLLGVLVIMAGLFLGLRNTSFVRSSSTLNRIASISVTDRTTQARFILWKDMAIPGAMEKPIFGWGQENFNYVFNKYYQPNMWDQEQWFDRTHNEFLDWLVAGGIPAFLLYISFFVLAVWAIVRSDLSVPEQAAFLGLLTAYGFSNLTVFHDLMSFAYFFLILAFAYGLSGNALPRFMFLLKPMNDKWISVAAPIVAVVILGGAWILNADGIARAQTIISAIANNDPRTGAPLTPEQHLAAFKSALSGGNLGKQETLEQLFQFASNGIAPSTSVSPQLKQDVFNYTHQMGDDFLKQRPNDARLELFMSVFVGAFGQSDEAINYLKKASADSPNKQQILFQLGVAYIQKNNFPDAIATLKKAFDLAPSYDSARILYAGGLFYSGQKVVADKLLTDRFGSVITDDDQLLQVYTNTKQWDRVIAIWQLRVKNTPANPDFHLGLAAAYFQSGNGPKTISELQEVAKLDPSRAGQVQQLITQIQNGTVKPGQQ
jgi:O-antigen ligase/tetratricopeptide (TPR) repeat protein